MILTKALWLGIAAASLIFLSGYAGMVSLGQVGLYAIAAFTMANLVAADGGLDVAWSPWLAVIVGIGTAGLVGLLFGAVASRSEGIYFLMITLALGDRLLLLQPGHPAVGLRRRQQRRPARARRQPDRTTRRGSST